MPDPYSTIHMIALREAEILAPRGDSSVQLLSQMLVALVLGKIKLCMIVSMWLSVLGALQTYD